MKNNVYPCKPQFYYIKVGFKGVNIIKVCFRDGIIRASTFHSYALKYPIILLADSKGPDQTARMRLLIWAFFHMRKAAFGFLIHSSAFSHAESNFWLFNSFLRENVWQPVNANSSANIYM